MKWRKLGRVFSPDNNFEWMCTHAANPVAEYLGGDHYRIYFSSRDNQSRSSIGWIEIDLRKPTEVLRISELPVLAPGRPGMFDDSGASVSCLVRDHNKRYLFYVGWNLGVTVPWRNSIGLATGAVEIPGITKYSEAPVMDRDAMDPYSLSYPWVMLDNGLWKMWYGSNLSWGSSEKDMNHVIKYAESRDGIHWERSGVIAVNFQRSDEYALARPCVVKDGNRFKMWYSYRGKSYRIGYAESPDGIRWVRKDQEAGIDAAVSGWDSEMIEYPSVFDHQEERYMLFNGNGYGKSGFGLAVLVDK